MAKNYRGDPLRRIPPAATLRARLAATQETARRLTILLETAERLERIGDVIGAVTAKDKSDSNGEREGGGK